MRNVIYFQVAISNPQEQLDLIKLKLEEGWEIISAVACMNVIQYILSKDETPNSKTSP